MRVLAKADAKSAEGWLDPGVEYIVLAVRSVPQVGSQYLLWSEKEQTAALFPASHFDIVEPSLSPVWIAKRDLNGYLELAPKEWLGDDFWERFHDGDPAAEAAFRTGVEAIRRA
jgi:hypothetical protein